MIQTPSPILLEAESDECTKHYLEVDEDFLTMFECNEVCDYILIYNIRVYLRYAFSQMSNLFFEINLLIFPPLQLHTSFLQS